MSDERLRELAREVEAGGGPPARLRLAAALERAGRPLEALEALLPARDDAAARAALARLAQDDPLLRAPRPRWIRLPDGPQSQQALLAAGPLGVVVGRRDLLRVDVLDPDTGETRWELPWAAGDRWPQVAGAALLAWTPPALVARDLWSGASLWRAPLPEWAPPGQRGEAVSLLALPGRLVAWDEERVWARELPEAGPPAGLLWSARGELHGPVPLACRGLLLLRERGGWQARDLGTGAPRGPVPGEPLHADEAGLLVRRLEGLEALPDPLGPPAWSLRGVWHTLAWPRAVILEHREGDALWNVAHDRASGARLGLVVEVDEATPHSAAGEVVFLSRGPTAGFLAARTVTGETVWDLELPTPLAPPRLLVPLAPRRLLGLDQEGRWFCLEEGP